MSGEVLPKTWEKAHRLLDDGLREVRERFDAEPEWSVVPGLIDTGATPYGSIEIPGLRSAPLAVFVLRAMVRRSTDGRVLSTGSVVWEWRGGRILIHDVWGVAATTKYDTLFALAATPRDHAVFARWEL